MNGFEIEYLLAIYFIVTSLNTNGTTGKLEANTVRLISGLVLFVLAVLKITFI